jgi:hypothetical protein
MALEGKLKCSWFSEFLSIFLSIFIPNGQLEQNGLCGKFKLNSSSLAQLWLDLLVGLTALCCTIPVRKKINEATVPMRHQSHISQELRGLSESHRNLRSLRNAQYLRGAVKTTRWEVKRNILFSDCYLVWNHILRVKVWEKGHQEFCVRDLALATGQLHIITSPIILVINSSPYHSHNILMSFKGT